MREYLVGLAGVAVLASVAGAQIQTSAPGRAPSGVNVQAEVIWNQDYFGGNGYVAQEFDDFPTYNSYHFDDFFTTQAFKVTTLTVPGVELGNPNLNTAVVGRITTEANALATPVMTSVGGFEDAFGNLVIDFGGQVLPPGDYWVSAYVVRNFGAGGQWFWGSTTPMYGSEAIFHNPGGGFGFGGNPIPASVVQGVVADMAFTLEGEPVEGGECYPDCDGNEQLNLFDFLCFTSAFNAGDSYADCDESGALNLFDFLCFTSAFNAGC